MHRALYGRLIRGAIAFCSFGMVEQHITSNDENHHRIFFSEQDEETWSFIMFDPDISSFIPRFKFDFHDNYYIGLYKN